MIDIKAIKEKTQNFSILIVDDEIELLKSIEKFMSKFFEKVEIASNGEEGLEKYKLGNYDVLMSDIQMPKLCGDEMVKIIREEDKDIFIALLTGTPDEETKFLEEFCDTILVKPIDMSDLSELLKKIVEKKGK